MLYNDAILQTLSIVEQICPNPKMKGVDTKKIQAVAANVPAKNIENQIVNQKFPPKEVTQMPLYRARVGLVNLDSARQSKIEASSACVPNEEDYSQIGKADEEGQFCKVAASPNLPNQPERGIDIQGINDFVVRFLHPYITGKINEHNEPKNRKPLIELVSEKFPTADAKQKHEIQNIVFKAYVKQAALGLYVNRQYPPDWIINSDDVEFFILLNALYKSLPKDFPHLKLSRQELVNYAEEILNEVNKEKDRSEIEAKNFVRAGSKKNRRKKYDQLKKTGNLFLN